MGLRVFLLMLGAALLALLAYWQGSEDDPGQFGANLLVFLLVNLNIAVLCLLIFLVGRNVVKLVFDRRRKVLGSRLRMRLVMAFVGLALIPTIIIFFLASGMVTRVMEGWFSSQADASVTGAVEIARHHYNTLHDMALDVTREIALDIEQKPLIYKDPALLKHYLEQQRKEQRLFSLTLYQDGGRAMVVQARNAAATIEHFSEPPPNRGALEKAAAGDVTGLFESKEASQFVRIYYPTRYHGNPAVLLGTLRVDPELANSLTMVNDSYKEYQRLKLFRGPLRSSYILTLAMITGLILFAAIWIGFYIAREITVPIQRLAEGTRAVARGNYDFQLKVAGDDELSFLARSFNTMTADLKQSRSEVERRRSYLEAILARLAVGVIAVDMQNRVTSVNGAASALFALDEEQAPEGQDLRDLLSSADYRQIEPLLELIEQDDPAAAAAEREIDVLANGRVRKVVCTAGSIVDAGGRRLGTVLLFDDVTDLVKAQQTAAWREVARRIAHEIKNPLTPIQLSAQRLQKLLAGGELESVVCEATQTIVEHVDSIKRLANEFAKFDRMPAVELSAANLNTLISDVLTGFAEHHPQSVFQFIADGAMPDIPMDREQIRRVLINLIDNALAACASAAGADTRDEHARITIKSRVELERGIVAFEVADNGTGINRADRSKIFEPYVTGKEGGTGLGLAIVAAIIVEHHGEIKVFDNPPRGARFVIELPITARTATKRKLAAA